MLTLVPGNTDTRTGDTDTGSEETAVAVVTPDTGTDDTDTGSEETTLAVVSPDTGDTDCDKLLTVLTQAVVTDGEVSDTPAEPDASIPSTDRIL